MKKFLILLFFLFLSLSSNSLVLAEEKTGDNQQKQADNGQSFENAQDSTLRQNQKTTDSKIFTPNSPFAQQAFVPDISLIFDSSYVYRDLANDAFGGLKIPGFTFMGDFEKNGLNLNYAELSIASAVDPYFDLMAVIPFTTDGVGIEEAFINTKSLPFNFQLKAGKFRSSWGRLNSQHEHIWDFIDPPVVYSSIFGGEQLNEKGVQINWLAPLDTYLLLGTEILQGENEKSFGAKGFTIGKNIISESVLPNLFLGFAKTSFDIGDLTILGGVSYAQGGTKQNQVADDPKNTTGFDGFSRVLGADLTLKYFLTSYTYLALQSEFMYRAISGNRYDANNITPVSKNQSGLYSQLTWRFHELWKTGIRYDLLLQNDIFEKNINMNNPGNLAKYSAMIEYDLTEFSRIRLQYNYDRSKHSDDIQSVNEIFLQLNMAIGSHGAHAF